MVYDSTLSKISAVATIGIIGSVCAPGSYHFVAIPVYCPVGVARSNVVITFIVV